MSNKTLRQSESKNFEMNTNKPEEDKPLKRSTYNIYEAYNTTEETLLYSSSIHPLDATPYAFDLRPNTTTSDVNTMMHNLHLSTPPSPSMPYCK